MNRVDNNVSTAHYDVGGVSMYDIWKAKLSAEEFIGLCKGNILKYIIRAEHKNGVEDYRKAAQFFEWLLTTAEERQKTQKGGEHND